MDIFLQCPFILKDTGKAKGAFKTDWILLHSLQEPVHHSLFPFVQAACSNRWLPTAVQIIFHA